MCVSGYSTSSGFVVQNSGYIPLNRTYHCSGSEAGLTNCWTKIRSYCFNRNYFTYIKVHCKGGPGKYNIHVFELLILFEEFIYIWSSIVKYKVLLSYLIGLKIPYN